MEQGRKYILTLGAAALIGAAIGLAIRHKSPHPAAAVDLPAPAWPIAQAIDEAAGYLVRVDDDKGRFIYMQSADGRHIGPTHYNVVRHAGAIYALADYEVEGSNAEMRAKARDAADRSAQNLVTNYARPLKAHPDIVAVWSDPTEEGGHEKRFNAKLGGTGLGLIGLMGRYRAVDGGANPAADLAVAQGLGRFLVFMQKDDGDFISNYTDEKGKSNEFESLYYPGESILGLTMLYEVDRDPKWLAAAAKGIAHLVEIRKGKKNLPADHWLMIAMNRLYPLFGDMPNPPLTRDAMVDHALALADTIIDGQDRVERPEIDGCYTRDGRTTPTATRLEGLLATEHMLGAEPSHAAERERIRASIVRGIAFLRRAQVTDGPVRGALPKAVKLGGEVDGGDASGDDSEDTQPGDHRGEVRIDYVQHAMSAMMRYVKMCAAEPSACPKP